MVASPHRMIGQVLSYNILMALLTWYVVVRV
jgi:hypothetical protein